ncbi:MAG: hypothetical protein ACPLRA_03975, partial [Candidatus Saccharicenans sp.]
MSRRLSKDTGSFCLKNFAGNFLLFLLLFTLTFSFLGGQALSSADKVQTTKKAMAVKVSKEKKFVLDWLGQKEQLEFFGHISDRIWSFAELGLQEYKSSSLLA